MHLDTLFPTLNGLNAAIFVLDANRRVLLVNDAGKAQFGAVGTGTDFVQTMRNPACLKAIAKVLGGQEKSETVVALRNPVHATYQVVVTRSPGSSKPCMGQPGTTRRHGRIF